MAILHVETIGNDQTGDGSANKPWLTISHAVAQAAATSIIEIGPGKFTEALLIDKDLTLRGKGPDETVVFCPPNLPKTTIEFESSPPPGPVGEHINQLPLVHVSGQVKVRFENLEFQGNQHPIGLCASAKDVELEVETCRVLGFLFCHIVVMDGKLVVSNSRCGTPVPFIINSDLGILLGNKSRATITNTEVGNRSDHCIDLYQDSFAEVTHCTLLGSISTNTNGIRLSGNARADIYDNTILGQDTKEIPSNTSQAGIQIGIQTFDTASADIHHNVIKGFSTGIDANCNTASRVWGNTITNNFNRGVWVFSADGVPDLGGGPHGSPGENIIKNNGELSGIEMELRGDFTCFARFNDWGTTDPVKVLDRVKLTKFSEEKPLPVLDFLPFKQIPSPQPLDSVLLLDQSGSMLNEGKWKSALAAADVFAFGSSFINFDLAQINLALITFAGTDDGNTSVWQELSALPSVPSPISSLITTAPDPSWTTPMGSGLKQAHEMLDASSSIERRRYIFLLSDGKANTGPSPEESIPALVTRSTFTVLALATIASIRRRSARSPMTHWETMSSRRRLTIST